MAGGAGALIAAIKASGVVVFTKSANPLALPAGAEVVSAGRIWIPG